MADPARRRVLFVINDLARAGAETQLVALVLALPPDRYQRRIVLLKERNDFADVLLAEGVEVVPLRRRRAADMGVVLRLAREMRRFRPDVVHSFLFFANLITVMAARLARPRRVVLSQRCSYEAMLGPFWRRVARLSHRLADRVIVNSRAALHEELAAGTPPERLVHVPNLARGPRPQGAGTRSPLPSGRPLVLSLGQLDAAKGHRFLVEAWAEISAAFPEARLVLIGDGPCRPALEALTARLKLASSVTLLGFQPGGDAYLPACDLLVQPSVTEGLPNAVLEAMAAGRAVVGTRVGGLPELVEDGVSGLLVPAADPPALAAAILTLLRDPARRERMGAAGRQRACQLFTPEAVREAVEAVYAGAADPAPFPPAGR